MRKKTGIVDKNNFEKLYSKPNMLYQYIRYNNQIHKIKKFI